MVRFYCFRFWGFHNLASSCLVTIVSLVLVFVLYQFVSMNECQIIYFKHQQGEKRSTFDQFQSVGRFNSTCSPTADLRGPHQKVIAYSIYGDFSRVNVVHQYLKPLKETLRRIPLIYPGSILEKQLSFNSIERDYTILTYLYYTLRLDCKGLS
jgi:hypothetical protein